MYKSITFSTFCDAFHNMDRNDQFTYKGKQALFDYLEELESATGMQIELDVIALCCYYSEEPLADVLENYSLEDLTELEQNTQVINFDTQTGLVIYQNY